MKERVTVSVEPEALEIARAEVASGQSPNLSAAIEAALEARGRTQALWEAVDLAEREHGPVSKEMEEWAIEELERARRETLSSMRER